MYKVREKSTEEIYEVIEIQMKNPQDDQEKKYVLRHLCYLQAIDNPSIIKFCGFGLKNFNNKNCKTGASEHYSKA